VHRTRNQISQHIKQLCSLTWAGTTIANRITQALSTGNHQRLEKLGGKLLGAAIGNIVGSLVVSPLLYDRHVLNVAQAALSLGFALMLLNSLD
jgi:hypothetical protein